MASDKQTVATKFSAVELDKLDAWVEMHDSTRSSALRELCLMALDGIKNAPASEKKDKKEPTLTTFRFLADYSYFVGGHEYQGYLLDGIANIKFGGSFYQYKLSDLPVEVH